MADFAAGAGPLGSAVGDIFGGVGELKAAKGLKTASRLAQLSATINDESTRLKTYQQQRELYQTLGGQRADYGGAGLAMSGSALDVLRDSASQGALAKQLIVNQGAIDTAGYQAEAANYAAQASAAKTKSTGSFISGALNLGAAAFAIFSDDALKEDIVKVGTRPDGIGIYHFRFKGQPDVFKGVLAQEVQKVYPHLVTEKGGFLAVDYAGLGVIPEVVKEAA